MDTGAWAFLGVIAFFIICIGAVEWRIRVHKKRGTHMTFPRLW